MGLERTTSADTVSRVVDDVIAARLQAKETELRAKLAGARAELVNPGNRGDAAEIAVRDFLADHLPRTLEVGQGEVIDSEGGRSPQTDVVITTQDHPFRYPPGDPGLFLVEGVVAFGEVKTRLTHAELDDCFRKGAKAKALQRLNFVGSEVFTNDTDRRRWVEGPTPFFVFAFETALDPESLLRWIGGSGTPSAIDAVFVLGKGAAIDFADGEGSFRMQVETTGRSLSGWAWMENAPALLTFLSWLHGLPVIRHRTSPLNPYLKSSGIAFTRHDGEER